MIFGLKHRKIKGFELDPVKKRCYLQGFDNQKQKVICFSKRFWQIRLKKAVFYSVLWCRRAENIIFTAFRARAGQKKLCFTAFCCVEEQRTLFFTKIWSRNRQRNYEDVSSQSAIFAFCFFCWKKTPERTRNCEDVSSQTPVFPQKIQTIYHVLTNWKAKLWGRLKPNVRFWNVTIDSTTVLVCKIVRTSQAKRPFFNFFKQTKSKRDREIVRTSQPKRPFLKKHIRFLMIFFHKFERETSREIVRTSQANRPFSFFLFFFLEQKSDGENTKLWGRLTPNALFLPPKNKHFFIFFQKFDRETGSEIMRTSQANRQFLLFVFFVERKRRREREIVRTSQAKRPFSPKKYKLFIMFWQIGKRNCEDVSSQTSVFET